MDNDDALCRYSQLFREGSNRVAGEVHIGVGAHHQHLVILHGDRCSAELVAPHRLENVTGLSQEVINRHVPHIVARRRILRAGIAQTHNEPLGAQARWVQSSGLVSRRRGRAAEEAGKEVADCGHNYSLQGFSLVWGHV